EALAVLASQWLQAEALRYYVEETRRRWPDSAGIYPWQLNEPWPNITCTSAVEYGGRPKLAYFAVRGAYRPTIATARHAGLIIPPGEPLRAAVWLLNDGEDATCEPAVALHDLVGRELAAPGRHEARAPGNAGAHLCNLELPLPAGFEGITLLDLALTVD